MDKKRVITGALFFLILAAFMIASIWLPLMIVIYFVLVTFIAALELNHALLRQFRPLSLGAIIIGSLTALSPMIIWYLYKDLRKWHILKGKLPLDAAWSTDFVWLLSFGVLCYFLIYLIYAFLNVLLKLVRKGPMHFPHAVAEDAAAFYVSAPISMVILFMFAVPHGYFWLLYALVTPMLVDVAAYYVGSRLGRAKMLPEISPHKSWAGFFAGIVASILFSAVYFMIVFNGASPKLPLSRALVFGLLSGLVLGLVSQFGDWVASALKRWCRIKDFSNLLPGHGGILDRFDSMLFSLPACLILSVIFYMLKR